MSTSVCKDESIAISCCGSSSVAGPTGEAAPEEQTEKGRAPVWIWVLLAAATVGVSCAGAVFQHLDDVPPLLRASWRLQVCDLFCCKVSNRTCATSTFTLYLFFVV